MELEIGSLTDEVAPEEISLAHTQRRKSCRRSLMLLPSSDSPVDCSSPIVRMHRRSLGGCLHNACSSPVSSPSFQRTTVAADLLPYEATFQHIEEKHPATPIRPSKQIINLAETVPSPERHPPPNDVPPSIHVTPPESSPFRRPAETCLIDSVDALHASYLRELRAWPQFLAELEAKATAIRPPRPIPSQDQMADNPVLAPFAGILSGEDSFDAVAAQLRVSRAHCLAMCSLSRAMAIRKRVSLPTLRLKRQLYLVRQTKLRQLLPAVADSPSPTVRQLFDMADSSLSESD